MTEYFQAGLVDLEVSSLLPGEASSPYEWVTSVQLFNLTENLTVWLQVETEVGSLDKMFLVSLPDPSEMVSLTQQYQITLDG